MPQSKISFTKLHIRLLHNLAVCPYEWPKHQPFPISVTSRWKLFYYKVNLALNGIYPTVMFANYLLNQSKIETSQKMIALIFFDGYLTAFFWRLNFLLKEQSLIQLTTSFLLFEKNHIEKDQSRKMANKWRASDLVQHLGTGIIGPLSFPFLIGLLLVAKPCLVPHLGFILLTDHNGICRPNLLWCIPRLTFLLFDVYMYSMIFGSSSLYIFNTFFLLVRCLVQYLQVAKNILKNHTRTLPDKICDNGNNDSDAFRLYRQISFLSEMFNDTFQGLVVPVLMIGIWNVVMVGLYASVKLHNSIPMPGFAFFPLATVEGLLGVWIIKAAAKVVAESEKCLEKARRNTSWRRKSIHYKMMKSMGKVKVRFGSTNFVDHLTPFNLTNHALSNCATLMLLT